MRELNNFNNYIQLYKKNIAEILEKKVKPLSELIAILEKQRDEIILDSQFTWNGKIFKVSDMQWYNDWMYDDCPYTPGYKSFTETLKLLSVDNKSEFLTLPANEHGWYDNYHQQFKDFENFFIDKFGVSFKMILKKGEVKQ